MVQYAGAAVRTAVLFCTVEGFAHTHDRRRYFLRIWAIGTAMGTVEFSCSMQGPFAAGTASTR